MATLDDLDGRLTSLMRFLRDADPGSGFAFKARTLAGLEDLLATLDAVPREDRAGPDAATAGRRFIRLGDGTLIDPSSIAFIEPEPGHPELGNWSLGTGGGSLFLTRERAAELFAALGVSPPDPASA